MTSSKRDILDTMDESWNSILVVLTVIAILAVGGIVWSIV